MIKRLILIAAVSLACQGCWFGISGGDFGVIYKGAVDPGGGTRSLPTGSVSDAPSAFIASVPDLAVRGVDVA